jgi:hypothetical protein
MKWVAIFFLSPVFCFAQGVKVNIYDNFLKKHRIELEPVTLYTASNAKLSVTFISVESDLFLQVYGEGWGAATIDDGNEMIFLFNNDSTVTVKSTGLQTFDAGLKKSTYRHQYLVKYEDLKAFSQYELAGVRRYSFKEFFDLQIQKEYKAKLRRPGALFSDELAKAKVFKTLKQIDTKDIALHVGDSVSFCSKVYNSRHYESSENKPTVLDLQSNFSDPLVNIVIMDQDRRRFPEAPEKIYLNKDVCITGVVMMRNNIPYVILRSREQIKINAKPTLEEIALFVGDSVTVSGTIFSAKYFAESSTSPTLLNMGAPFPNQPLTVVIEKAQRPFFGPDPEVFYLNKEVSVSGRVVLFKNKPQIVVRSKEQIQVLKDNGPARVSNAMNASLSDAKPMLVSNAVQQPSSTVDGDERPAEFPGGNEAWEKFLQKHLRMPSQLEGNDTKTVIASFYVSTDGNISNLKIVQTAGVDYDKEVIRVLRLMPKWKPKTKAKTLMGVNVSQPITFRLETKEN